MAVTYSAEQKKRAKDEGKHLVTIGVAGMSFQGPVTEEERDEVLRFFVAFQDRRRVASTGDKPAAT